MFKATVHISLRPSILDPQGKATHHALSSLGFDRIKNVRIGKLIELDVDATSLEEARDVVVAACQKLLANPVMEDFEIELTEVNEAAGTVA